MQTHRHAATERWRRREATVGGGRRLGRKRAEAAALCYLARDESVMVGASDDSRRVW